MPSPTTGKTFVFILLSLAPPSCAWHDLGNADFHCWPLSATAANPVPYAACPGIQVEWILPPPEEIKAEEHFNLSYQLTLSDNFWPWAVSDQGSFKPNFFAGANGTGINDANKAREWCETTVCPADVKAATVINCCIHHVNVHSCPLSEVQNGLCGPWIPAEGSIFTHSKVLVGNSEVDEWLSTVEGLYQVGPTSIIAHFKLAGMHIALERSFVVKPRTECGDGVCETEEGEACDTCPRDCGRCPLRTWQIGIIGAVAALVVLVFAGVILFRSYMISVPVAHVETLQGLGTISYYKGTAILPIYKSYFRYKQQRLLWDESWIIDWDDIKPDGTNKGFMSQSRISVVTGDSDMGKLNSKQRFAMSGVYNGRVVAMKVLHKTEFSLTMEIRREVRDVRQLDHPQLVRFVGGCVEIPNVAIVTEYCPKGGLNDVLENDQIPINWSFRFSFATDICKAMEYLHSNRICHGRLKSSNCLVDDRWTVKVSDYGLRTYRCQDPGEAYAEEEDSLSGAADACRVYLAPECAPLEKGPPPPAAPPGDVYAFAIILVEIATRAGPYGEEDPQLVKPGWKPDLPDLTSDGTENTCPRPEQYVALIDKCWEDQPAARPTFEAVRRLITKINPDRRSPVDMMMAMMEKYSSHLEVLVAERTADLEAEKLKTDRLLYSMLPRQVADELRLGHTISAEEFDSCSIYFSDIVGFTTLCSASTPIQVVGLLNKLYTTFDSVIDEYDVYKVETIGDAYMVVSGVPRPNGDAHARQIALMSLDLLRAAETFVVPHVPDYALRIRIGIHSGSVCAGVVGLKMPRYCLFGDTVNTASRMESNGEAYKIHVSDVTRIYLERGGGFQLQHRGTVAVKGKGEMKTFWLLEPERSRDVGHTEVNPLPGACV